MSKDANKDKERRPDLSMPDQEVLEEKVRGMFEVDDEKETKEKKPDRQVINIKHDDDEKDQGVLSAPVLPSDTKEDNKVKINVIEHKELEIDDQEKEPETKEKIDVSTPEEDIQAEELEEDETPITDDSSTESDKEEEKYIEEIESDEEPETKLDSEEIIEKPEVINDEPKEVPPQKNNQNTSVGKVINDFKTSKAVEDIVAKEADDLLDLEDQKNSVPVNPIKKSKDNIFKRWWKNKKSRYLTLLALFFIVVSLLAIPVTRNKILNSIGVKAAVSVSVTDSSTGQPLKNVVVKINQSEAKTDSNGRAELKEVSLGQQSLIVAKRAFADNTIDVNVGIGSNNVDSVSLDPTGVQYSFIVVDYVSKKPLSGIEANFQEASGLSDDNGKIKLTLEDSQDLDNIDLTFDKTGYRQEKLIVKADDRAEKNVDIVLARKHIYVSNRDGKYSVFSSYIDGKEEQKILAGTGNEREDIDLKINPNDSVAAYVSTKSGQVNQDKFKLSTLTIINADNTESFDVVDAERIQLIGWIDDNLVFIQGSSGGSEQKNDRHKLMTYDYKSKSTKEIANSNYFNDAVIADKKIYYAPSGALQPEQAKLYRVKANGEEKTEIAQIEVFKIFRTDYENLTLSADQNWLNLRLNENKVTSITSPSTNPKSRVYSDSPDSKNSVWVDSRDGKGVLVNYQLETRNELIIASENGLINPVYWIDGKTIIYRVSNQKESADYVTSIDGGTPRKINDVNNVNSVDNWYYY